MRVWRKEGGDHTFVLLVATAPVMEIPSLFLRWRVKWPMSCASRTRGAERNTEAIHFEALEDFEPSAFAARPGGGWEWVGRTARERRLGEKEKGSMGRTE